MKSVSLPELIKLQGEYRGTGINHERREFTGFFRLAPIVGGRGLSLEFRATGSDGTVFHDEHSFIGPTFSESPALWVISNNHPAVIQHDLRRVEPLAAGGSTIVFGINDPQDKKTFREEISLDLYSNGDVGYRYFWGMPGGEFAERSGLRMVRSAPESAS